MEFVPHILCEMKFCRNALWQELIRLRFRCILCHEMCDLFDRRQVLSHHFGYFMGGHEISSAVRNHLIKCEIRRRYDLKNFRADKGRLHIDNDTFVNFVHDTGRCHKRHFFNVCLEKNVRVISLARGHGSHFVDEITFALISAGTDADVQDLIPAL